MEISKYNEFIEILQHSLEDDDRVLGLITLGSTASLKRKPDQWSDHDFFVIVKDNFEEYFRCMLDWLPYSENIIFHFRETEHGIKAIYQDGHLIEFAVFKAEELQCAKVNAFSILVDKSNLKQQVKQISVITNINMNLDNDYLLGQFITNILLGIGRYKRGEQLSAHKSIKISALHHLIQFLSNSIQPVEQANIDNFDCFRRFEHNFPALGQELNHILLMDILSSAENMILLMKRYVDVKNSSLLSVMEIVINRIYEK